MKYEYGVEYECNGVKPDLPDDVEIEIKTNRNPEGSSVSWHIGDRIWNSIHNPIKSFRIVDKRYKPQSNWHERGELPPVGEVVEVDGENFEVIAYRDWEGDKQVILYSPMHGYAKQFELCTISMRPLRTERDELIDIIDSIPDFEISDLCKRTIADAIIKSEWRPKK